MMNGNWSHLVTVYNCLLDVTSCHLSPGHKEVTCNDEWQLVTSGHCLQLPTHHLAVLLVLVLEVVDEAVDDLGGAHAVGDLHGGVDQLPVVG